MKIDQNFNLVAFCLNHGSKEEKYIEVKVSQISGWRGKDSYKEGTKLALEELFDKSHKPQHKVLVYNSDFVEIHGHLSCSNQTPLYTNGEMEVSRLELNNVIIWERWNFNHKINKEK